MLMEKVKQKLKPMGYTLTQTVEADGTLRIRASHKGSFYGLHGTQGRRKQVGQRPSARV